MRVVGIDPGKTGGLALVVRGKVEAMEVMPQEFTIMPILDAWKPDIVYLEKAQAMPGNGGVSMFNYAQSYGEIIGILKARKIPFVLVRPATWTKLMHKDVSGATPKEKSRKVALSRYPHMNFLATSRSKKPHEGLIDASIIADYGSIQEYNNGKHS